MRPNDLELEEEYKRTEESDEGSEDSDIGMSIMDYCWQPAISIGSTFVETTVNDPNKEAQGKFMKSIGNDDYETIQFYMDS